MAEQFDAEVKNSLASMQAAVVSLEGKVDKADRSLKRMQESARGVGTALHESAGAAEHHSASVEKLERGLEGSRKSARLLGGEAGTLTREFTELATNPWALAAGGAFALVGGAVEAVTEHVKELREQTEELVKVGEAGIAGKGAAVKGAVDATNVQEERRRAFDRQGGAVPSLVQVPQESRKEVLSAADQAVAAGLVKSQEEFVSKLLAAERPALDAFRKAADDQNAIRRATGSGPSASIAQTSRLLGERANDETRAPEPELAPNPFAGKTAAQLAVKGSGVDLSPDEFADRLRRAQQSETARLARIAEQRKATEAQAADAERARGLRDAAGEHGGLTLEDLRKSTPALDEAFRKSEAKIDALRHAAQEEKSPTGRPYRTYGDHYGPNVFQRLSRSIGLTSSHEDAIEEERKHQLELGRAAFRGINRNDGGKQIEEINRQAEEAAARQEELLKQQVEQSKQTLSRFGDLIDAVKTQQKGRADADAQVAADAKLQAALSQQAADQAAAATSHR